MDALSYATLAWRGPSLKMQDLQYGMDGYLYKEGEYELYDKENGAI